jgi:drug/metabolite transporter (DMT)-like permease
MCIFLIPLALLEHKLTKPENRSDYLARKSDLRFPVLVHVLLAGAFWSVNLECWVYGLQYTTTVRASVFASSHPLMLVIVLSILGQRVSCLEWSGVLVVIAGLLLCSGKGLFVPSSGASTVFGDGLCLCAAIGEVFVLINRAKTKKYVSLMQVFTLSLLLCCMLTPPVHSTRL